MLNLEKAKNALIKNFSVPIDIFMMQWQRLFLTLKIVYRYINDRDVPLINYGREPTLYRLEFVLSRFTQFFSYQMDLL